MVQTLFDNAPPIPQICSLKDVVEEALVRGVFNRVEAEFEQSGRTLVDLPTMVDLYALSLADCIQLIKKSCYVNWPIPEIRRTNPESVEFLNSAEQFQPIYLRLTSMEISSDTVRISSTWCRLP